MMAELRPKIHVSQSIPESIAELFPAILKPSITDVSRLALSLLPPLFHRSICDKDPVRLQMTRSKSVTAEPLPQP
jgi:hypothetical protein